MTEPNKIVEDYCRYLGITPDDLKSKRHRVSKRVGRVNLSEVRQCLALLLRKRYGLTLVEISKVTGNKDHTSVIHSVRRAGEKYDLNDAVFMRYWNGLTKCTDTNLRYGFCYVCHDDTHSSLSKNQTGKIRPRRIGESPTHTLAMLSVVSTGA
jgi:ATPase involved in DNA replication initiation